MSIKGIKPSVLLWAATAILLLGGIRISSAEDQGLSLSYARGFHVEERAGCKLVTVRPAWKDGGLAFRYLLVPRGKALPSNHPPAQVIRIPVHRVVTLSTTHLAYMDAAGLTDRLVGMGGGQYVNTPSVRWRIETGQIKKVDDFTKLNIEILMDLSPDLILTSASGLALSGLLMQNLFRNPLAGPSVLGISAGLVLAAILALARRVSDVMTLLIVGILFGFAVNAAVSVLIYFSVAERIQAYVAWTFGSFAAMTWDDLALFAPAVTAGLLGCQLIRKPLNGLLLGEDYARSMGLRIGLLRLVVIGLTSLLAGTVTAFCGPVAFIGVAVPHLGRVVLGSSDHRRLLPTTALLGGIVALAADLLAQFPGSQSVLPLNAVTALLGSPVIVWFILRRKNLQKTFAG